MAEMNKNQKIALNIIKDNIYMSLASTKDSAVWNSPMYYCFDKNHNFYFISDKRSRHSRNIAKNPLVACTVFNSQEKPENVNGVQFDGLCKTLSLNEIPSALKFIYSKKSSELMKDRFEDYKNPLSYLRLTNFRIYKIVPLHMYILDPNVSMEDRRVEVRV